MKTPNKSYYIRMFVLLYSSYFSLHTYSQFSANCFQVYGFFDDLIVFWIKLLGRIGIIRDTAILI